MDIGSLRRDLPDCCEIATAPVASYTGEAQAMILQFLPGARTVVVLGHHVQASLEWAWFPLASERKGTTCAADLHAKPAMESVLRLLESQGHKGLVLPYPGRCGVSFKRLAAATPMGEMGDSFLFVHRQWGPWVHLRVLLTDAEVTGGQPDKAPVCTHCGKCIEACPGNALSPGKHDLDACTQFQLALRDRFATKAGFTNKCEVCIRVCPMGQEPAAVEIKDK
jgi:epoxyqueuosine reductase